MASQAKSASTTMPSSVSSQMSLPMPPPPTGILKTVDAAQKKQTPVFQGAKSSAATPAVTTNNDVSVLYSQIKSYMEQQNKTNQRILREIEDMKKSKNATEGQTPLVPRMLDFTTPGSTTQQLRGSSIHPPGFSILQQGSMGMYQSGSSIQQQHEPSSLHQGFLGAYQAGSSMQTLLGSSAFQNQGSSGMQQQRSSEMHEGDIIPMQTIASSGPTVTTEMPYPGYPSGIPSLNQQRGNSYDNIFLGTNHGLMQNAGINQAMAKELQKLKDMISSVPGVVRPIPEIPDGEAWT